MTIYDTFDFLQQVGVADIILPFMLIFAIVFAILEQTKILGENKKNINAAVALVMGLSVVFPHVLGAYGTVDPVDVINKSLAHVSVWLVAILMLLILLGMFGLHSKFGDNANYAGWVVIAAVIIVGYIFLNSAGVMVNVPFLSDPVTQSLLVVLLVFGGIIWFITRPDKYATP